MFYIAIVISIIISVYELILVARAICSWVPYFRESLIYEICYTLTEPVLRPIRDLLFRFDIFRRCPIDFSSIILFLLLGVLSRVLFLFV